jgi:MFS family permease
MGTIELSADLNISQSSQRTPVYALMAAEAISQTGNAVTYLAIPWFVLATTGSATKTGITAFAGLVPMVLASLFGGALVDRVGNKRMSIIADLMSGFTVALVPALYLTVGLTFWQLLVLVFLGSLLDTPGGTARQALVPDLAERAGIGLEKINSVSQIIFSFARIAGPLLAGILIAIIGTSKVLWVDAASFGISALIVSISVTDIRQVPAERGRFLDDVWEGVRFLFHDKLLRTLLVAAAVLNFLFTFLDVALPFYVKETYGHASDLGVLFAGLAAGAIAGAIIFGMVGAKLNKRMMMVIFFGLISVPFLVFAASPSLAVATAAMVVAGFGSGGLNPLAITLLQTKSPAEMRARILGAVMAIVMVAAPLGALLGGTAVSAFGATTVIVGMSIASLAVTLWLGTQSALAELDDPNLEERTSPVLSS